MFHKNILSNITLYCLPDRSYMLFQLIKLIAFRSLLQKIKIKIIKIYLFNIYDGLNLILLTTVIIELHNAIKFLFVTYVDFSLNYKRSCKYFNILIGCFVFGSVYSGTYFVYKVECIVHWIRKVCLKEARVLRLSLHPANLNKT